MALTSAIVLAGGLGTRLRGAIGEIPKPVAPVQGRPFLEYLLDYWITQGINHFVIAVGYKSEIIMSHFGSEYRGATITYSVESTPLDTGGGFLRAARSLASTQPFLLLNGDSYFPVPLAELDEFARSHDAEWCLSTFITADAIRYTPLELAPDGRILSFTADKNDVRLVANAGVYWVHPRALALASQKPGNRMSLERQLLPEALSRGRRLFGVTFSQSFIDIGVPEDYERAPQVLASDNSDQTET